MLLRIPNVLSAEQVRSFRSRLDAMYGRDARLDATAGAGLFRVELRLPADIGTTQG